RRARAKKQFRDQAEAADAAGFIPAARVKSAKGGEIPVGRNVAVAAENATAALPEIRNDHDVSLVITSAGFDPCLPLAHVVRCSQVCVSIAAPDLQTTELVDQKEVDHTGNSVGAVHG